MLRLIIHDNATQQVRKEVPYYKIDYQDLRNLDEKQREQKLKKQRDDLSHQVLDVAKGEIFLFNVWRLPNCYRLYISLDMLIMDGTSIGLFFKELGQFYAHPELNLPAPAFEFRDYLLSLKNIKQSPQYLEDKAYWLDKLPNMPIAPALMITPDNLANNRPYFKHLSREISTDTWSQVKQKAKILGVSDTSVLLLLFGQMLAKWSNNEEFLIDITLFGRLPIHERVDSVIGDFTTLEIFAFEHNSTQVSFQQQLQAVHECLITDISHNLFSGIEVLRELSKVRGRDKVIAPVVFTSLLNIGTDLTSSEMGEVADYIDTPFHLSQTPQIWLDCQVVENAGKLSIVWDYVEQLFPENMIQDMHDTLCRMIETVATIDWTQATRNDYLQHEIYDPIAMANNTKGEISDQYLHTLFAQQVEKTPNASALISAEVQLSYRELFDLSARIANGLKANSVQPNTLIAVLMDKGWEQIPAVLGILNSGAAYLPINATYPEDRIHELLHLGEVNIVLAQPQVLKQVSLPKHIKTYAITTDCFIEQSKQIQIPVQKLSDIAYVIFTSGSTGTPKGVVIDHRGAVNTIVDINRRFAVNKKDRVLALSALNFDLSVYDIFGLLAVGGAIVMPSANGLRDPSHWTELMVKHQITLWNTVPALIQMLVEYQSNNSLNCPLRLSLLSGDWIPLDLPTRIKHIWSKHQIIGLGGATEASIWSNFYPINEVDSKWNSIPYGKPLTNQFFRILDDNLNSCSAMITGQLHIGGLGIALGYWRDEEKTNASFITHPQTGERLYRTGDLGRYLADGNIEFLGREDFQVKIQGNRIELGEIESQLLKHTDVKETIVVAAGDNPQDKQLVAYIVPVADINQQSHTITSEQLKQQTEQVMSGMLGEITNPTKRLQFKMEKHGIRQFDDNFHKVALTPVRTDDTTYVARQSYREFTSSSINLDNLSQLLGCLNARSFKESILPKYRYGSAGSLYPIQTYLYIKPERIENLAGGLYYYHPFEHELVLISTEIAMYREQHAGTNDLIFDSSAFSLFLVADYQAINPMYESSSRDFCLLEAGYISQLLMMEASDFDLGLCPIGGMNFGHLQQAFGLNEHQEMIHSFIGGGINEKQKQQLNPIMSQTNTQVESTKHIVPAGIEIEPLTQCLKTWLIQKLPAYMCPHLFVELPALPLTANGKIDRKALPQPQEFSHSISEKQTNIEAETKQFSSELEEYLIKLVKSQLNVTTLEREADFFDLGANSLDMVQLYNEIKAKFPTDIAIASIFTHASIAKLVELLNENIIIDTPKITSDKKSVDNDNLTQRLTILVQQQFNLSEIEPNDDFFDHGANSLDMVQLYNEIKAQFQTDITVASLFTNASIAKLVKLLKHNLDIVTNSQVEKTTIASTLDPEQIDQISANLDNLTDAEVEQLLSNLS
jgi:amino acid adenylation domain-containing protein